MKKKLVTASLTILFLLITILIVTPLVIDTTSLKSELEQKISQKIGATFQVKGGVKIAFLPIPKISLKNSIISQISSGENYYSNINVENLIIRPNILSLFGKKVEIKELIFESPKIENNYTSSAKTKEQPKVLSNNFKIGTLSKIFNFVDSEVFDFHNIRSVHFKNGSFIRRNIDNEVVLEFHSINFFLENDLIKQIFRVEGGFLSEEEPTSFVLNADVKNDAESSLIVQSAILNLSLSGKFLNSHIDDLVKSNFTGKVDAQIIDLKAFLNKYVSKNNLLYRKINSTQPIKISSKIENKAGELDITNIVINSSLMEGVGEVRANLTKDTSAISANFDFDNIDIDSIWFSGALNGSNAVVNVENEIIHKFLDIKQNFGTLNDENKTYLIEKNNQSGAIKSSNVPLLKNLDLTASIKIKAAKYYNDNLRNISLNFITSNHNLFLQPLLMEIPGRGLLKVSGSLEQESNIPKFIGKIEILGGNLQKSLSWLGIDMPNLKPKILNDYSLNSNLLILPNFNIFSNFNLAINNNKNIVSGNLKIDDSTGIFTKTANLKINSFNYDDYFITNIKNPYLSSGSLLKKLLWLNSIDSNHDISISFDQLTYRGNTIDNQGLRIKFGQGYLKFSEINFLFPDFNIKGSIDLDVSNNSPKINIDIACDNLKYENSSTENLENKTKNQTLGDEFFELPAIDEFSGAVTVDIKNLILNSWQASNINIAGKIKNGILNFDNFILKTYSGEAQYKGSVVFKVAKTINGSIELVGVDGGQVLNSLMNIKNISGISNISAIVNSSADNKVEFFKNLDASGQFIGANIGVKGFGIYDLALKVAQPKKYQEELSSPTNILYNPNTTSVLKDISGIFSIKKSGKDQFRIETKNLGINGIVSGELDLNNESLDANANFIFISGTRESQIPINIAINFKGRAGSIEKNNNLTQVDQYLKQKLPSPNPPQN